MRETLTYVISADTPLGLWVLAAPVGGGVVQALTVDAANQGAADGWLENWPPPTDAGLAQARQTQPEGGERG